MDNLVAYIATAVISLSVGLLLMYVQPKAKLVYWSSHNFLFRLVPEGAKQETVLQTDALTVQNLGRKPAEAVEMIMTTRPDFFQFTPAEGSDQIRVILYFKHRHRSASALNRRTCGAPAPSPKAIWLSGFSRFVVGISWAPGSP